MSERPEPGAERTVFAALSSRSFEHPADRAALAAMRRVPGFDTVLRKIIGFVGERGLRYLHLASAVKVGPTQLARLNRIYDECLEVLDMPRSLSERPDLFVARTPVVTPGAIGVDRPFVVLQAGALEVFGSDDDLRFLLGHELGHILCDHALYKSMKSVLTNLSVTRLGYPFTAIALYAILAALEEWDRKSALTCDRAGLLCVQDPDKAYGTLLRMAGGVDPAELDLGEIARQAEEYEAAGDSVDGIFKLLNLLRRSQPFAVLRAVELQRWVGSGDYARILSGDYERRVEAGPSVFEEVRDSARNYGESFQKAADPVVGFLKDLGGQVSDTTMGILSTLRGALRGRGGRDDDQEGGAGDREGSEG